jgi:hypothetical protein
MRNWSVVLACVVLGVTAHAQTTRVAPSAAQRCLTRGELLLGTPVYPDAAYRLRIGAKVEVDMRFGSPDATPDIARLKLEADGRFEKDFESAVRDFVAAYRVPCLPSGESVSLKQEFVFVPHDGRPVAMYSAPDAHAQRKAQSVRCVRHARPGTTPEYPLHLLRSERQGNVVLRLVFADAVSAPRTEVLDDGGARAFAETASEFAAEFRMPCHDGEGPVDLVLFYVFRMEGGPRVTLPDLSLLSLLRGLKGIESANAYFDFNTMGCPFDVRFEPLQPVLPNAVGEIGTHHPERRFFLEWLTRQQIDLPKPQLNALLGQRTVVTVPCTVLHLGANAGGGASK